MMRPGMIIRLVAGVAPFLAMMPTEARAAPVITRPVLAIVNNPDNPAEDPGFIPVSITGSGFGSESSGSYLEVTERGDVPSPVTRYEPSDPEVLLWRDERIVVSLPVSLSHPRVTVVSCDLSHSESVIADRYEYRYFAANDGAAASLYNPVPLAVTNDGDSGYLLEEFGNDFKRWDLDTGLVTKANLPPYDNTMRCPSDDECFGDALYTTAKSPNHQVVNDHNDDGTPDDADQDGIPDDSFPISGAGESTIVDSYGRLWFSQGGAGGYGGIHANHSRIVSYDPNAAVGENPFRVYNVPGDNNLVYGLAWDGERIWFSSAGRGLGGLCPGPGIYPTRLMSFVPVHPDPLNTNPHVAPAVYDPSYRFKAAAALASNTCDGGNLSWDSTLLITTGTAGTCRNNPDRKCYSSNDCALAEFVCDGDADDGTCFHEYPLERVPTHPFCGNHHGVDTIGHLAVSSIDGAIWYTAYNGLTGDQSNRVFVGRFDPAAAPAERERHYPLHYFNGNNPLFPNFPAWYNGPWEVAEAADGDMLFSLDNENSVARFDMTRWNDPACLDLTSPTTDCDTAPDATCSNPCMDVRKAPGFDEPDPPQLVHSIAEDTSGNVWFTQYHFIDEPWSGSVGFWNADRSGLVMFPTFSLYADAGAGSVCGRDGPDYRGFSGAGITVNESNDDVWFADFCRKRIGRLRKIDDPQETTTASLAKITQPVVAIVNDPDQPGAEDPAFVALVITGSGFGSSETAGSKLKVRDTTHDVSQTHIYGTTDPHIVLWSDTRIVAKLPAHLDHPAVWLRFADGSQTELVTADRYDYRYFATNLPPSGNPSPYALAVGGGGNAYLIEQWHSDLKKWDAGTGAVSPISGFPLCPSPGCFALQLFGNDIRTNTSVLGDEVMVDPTGTVWFAQGGGGSYTGQQANHSRIVSYAPGSPGTFKVYNIPGDDNEISGLAWHDGRIWFSERKRQRCIGYACATAQPARIVSFDPQNIPVRNNFDFVGAVGGTTVCDGGSLGAAPSTPPVVGTCRNNPLRGCFTSHDCVLISELCPAGATSETDSMCYHEYPVSDATQIVKIASDPSASSIWFANYFGFPAYIGRLNTASGAITRYPVRYTAPGFFPTGPLQVAVASNGDVLFSHPSKHTVARLDGTRLEDPDCTVLHSTTTNCVTAPNPTCANSCIEERIPAGFTSVAQNIQGVAEDPEGRAWFSQGGYVSDIRYASSVGFWKKDRSDLVLFPSPQLYGTTGSTCSSFGGFAGTDLAIDESNGDVWVTDYCRKQIGRLRRHLDPCTP